MKTNLRKLEPFLFALCALLLVVVIPVMHSAHAVSDFSLSVWAKYLCYSILALSVDLLWGYTGLLSLGQALFFALGGYMLGMYLMLMIGKLGQYKSDLPDFMVFLGHTFLPWFWRPFSSFPVAVLMVFLVPGLLALAFGWLAFRSRIKGVYFSILTQALTFAASLLFLSNDTVMGGNNGFTDFKFILGADIRSAGTQRILFICTSLVLLAVYALCRWLTTSRFGLIQRAIRDSETRVLFSGYPVARFKLFIFVLSAFIASVGGALFVPQVGIINPSEMATDKSLEAIVWCAVGGRGTLIGPVVGAVAVNWLKSWASHDHPEIWPILLGGLFIIVVVLMPGGIVGLPAQLRPWFAKRRADAPGPPPTSPQEPKLIPAQAEAPEVTV
jgi:urea ABC transporter permease protein UrtC